MVKFDYSKRNILKYVGDLSQMFGTKEYTMNDGKAKGVRAIDIKNGSGLEFTILPDRCMDIAWLSYMGKNISYISKTGIVAPQYYNESGVNFLRSFYAGFLTTCGLSNVGAACVDDGEKYGLHGRISNTPAENVSSCVEWINDEPFIKVKGKMRESKVFGENLVLNREIICKCGENKFTIEDTVENYDFNKEPIMILYHFNLGYPILDENAEFLVPSKDVKSRDENAMTGIKDFSILQKPTANYREQVFYHDLKTDTNGNTFTALINENLELGLAIKFNKNQLFNLTQWKQMGEGEYVLGIEPCNCYGSGRADLKKRGVIEYIEPGEVRKFQIEVEILDGLAELNSIKDKILKL